MKDRVVSLKLEVEKPTMAFELNVNFVVFFRQRPEKCKIKACHFFFMSETIRSTQSDLFLLQKKCLKMTVFVQKRKLEQGKDII